MNAASPSSSRRYNIDWLRVALILTVFFFHSIHFFDSGWWHVKNGSYYEAPLIAMAFISRWMMPAIFMVSGVATFYSLRKSGPARFLKDRALRLLVPLAFGLLTHVPLQGYYQAVSWGYFRGSFLEWYPTMFDGLDRLGGSFNWIGNHLWYINALILVTLVTLPLLVWLLNDTGKRAMSWLGDRLSAPGAVFLLAVPTLALLFTLNPDNGGILTDDGSFGGWALPNYVYFFLVGFLLASSERLQDAVRRVRWISLVTGTVVFLAGGVWLISLGDAVDQPFGTPIYLALAVLSALLCWLWILAIFGFTYSIRRLNVRTPLLAYANEAVMPFYLLHQSVLIAVGFYVVQWSIPDLLKWVVIFAGSLAVSLLTYEFIVRRFNPLRVLFGLKPVRKEETVLQPAPQLS